MHTPPLNGIRILDLTQALAGPHCTQLLADLGADVIKVEPPEGGDQSRAWGPPFVAGESTYFLGTNRNKRSIVLDLKAPAGQEILYRLVDSADVLIHNVPREESRRRLGIDADTIRARNPRIIWASISGFGLTGPAAERPGYDILAQAMSGTMALTGEPEQGPVRFPTAMADISAGLYATIAILAALVERGASQSGQDIDVALLDAQATWLANVASAFLQTGQPPVKRGNQHPSITPYEPFEAADGWFVIAVGTQRQWHSLLDLLEAGDDLRADERFSTNATRVQHREALVATIQPYFHTRTVAEWCAGCEAASIPAGPIYRPEEALRQPQLLAREMVVEVEHPTVGRVQMLGNPIKMSRTPANLSRPAPLLGQHTEELLQALGYSPSDIERLRQERVIG